MAIAIGEFGSAGETDAAVYTFGNDRGMMVRVSTYGAILTSVEVPDRDGGLADVVLGFDELGGYLREHPYFGATVGRVANRIRNARFNIEGEHVDGSQDYRTNPRLFYLSSCDTSVPCRSRVSLSTRRSSAVRRSGA
jgi:galactose mutarotase-like enzyme